MELFKPLRQFLALQPQALLRGASNHPWVSPLEAYSSAIAFERVAIQEGLRAATGIASVITAAVWLRRPELAPAAFAAFWACLADPGGSYRWRFGFMGLFAATGTLTAFVASAAAGVSPLAAAAALVPLVFLPSLSSIYGAEASRVGTLVCVVAVVGVANPHPPEEALQSAGFFFCGCLWAMILCIVIWRVHRFAPARRAIAAAFGQLEAMTEGLLQLESSDIPADFDWDAFNTKHRGRIRATIEQARGVVALLETSDRRYRIDIETADQVFASLIAIGHALAARPPPADAGRAWDFVGRLRRLLAEAQRQVAQLKPEPAILSSGAKALQVESSAVPSLTGRAATVAAAALSQLCDSWRGAPRLPDPAAAEAGAVSFLRPVPATALAHAARVAIAVAIAYAIGSWLNLTFSYWATMAAVVVVQPEATSTWQRSIERVVGSMAGGLLAAGLMFVLPTKMALLALVFPIAAATIAFRLVNYAIFVGFLTVLFVLVTELLQPAAGVASVRVLNNVIGSLVGLGASLLLRRGERDRGTYKVLVDAVSANFAYAAGVCAAGASSAELDRLRRAAGVASNAAESVQRRITLAGQRGRAHVAEMAELLRALRRLAGSVIAASLAAPSADPARGVALARVAQALARALEVQAAANIPTTPATGPQDDVDRAVRGVSVAAAAYINAFTARG